MTRRILVAFSLTLLICVVFTMTLQPITTVAAFNLKSGAVFVLTNQTSNAVGAFDRAPDGTLTFVGEFSTGGSGNPVAQEGDPPTNPLASQGALVLSDNDHFLFAVNAGSNEISALSVDKDNLTLVDRVSSRGVRPISLTVHGDFLYVLNEDGTPNITGFTISNKGELTPLAGSTRPLSAGSSGDPAEVSFNTDGSLLVVTDKLANVIDVYVVGSNGVAGPPTPNGTNGMRPFGFAFDQGNHLIVSETGGAPNAAAVSSYTVVPSKLSVVTGSVRNSQTAASWIVITKSGQYVFTTNAGSGAVSSYTLTSTGELTLLNSAAANLGAISFPIDIALSNGSRYLYVIAAGLQTVEAFRVEPDGSLTPIGSVGGLPFGTQGIAAR